jgi:hypothetical protein
MLLALDFIVQWPPLNGVVSSQQNQITNISANLATLYTYEAEHAATTMIPLVWYCTVVPSLRMGGDADSSYIPLGGLVDIIVSGKADESITKCYSPSGIIHVENGISADCQFIPSTITKDRGGRGAYTRRKTQVQPHHYIYAVAPIKENGVSISGEADCEFVKLDKFAFLKQLPKVQTPTLNIVDVIPEYTSASFVYEAEIDQNLKLTSESDHDYLNYDNILIQEEEDLLCYLITDMRDDIVVVSMKGSNRRNNDDEILEILGFL